MNEQTGCVFSPCRKYRYTLWRGLYPESGADPREFLFGRNAIPLNKGYAMFIGLNPSTADEEKDDPTIRRCIDFARRWGYARLCMTNLFGWRDTKPERMKRARDPIGPENDRWLLEIAKGAGIVVAAWGKHGSFQYRSKIMRSLLRDAGVKLHALRTNKDGSPEHPLYIPAETVPFLYD